MVDELRSSLGSRVALLDEHSDPVHNRTVFTLAGDEASLLPALVRLADLAVGQIDVTRQVGAHPRIGSIAEVGLLETPVSLTVREGHLVEASGDDGARLMELLTAHGDDGTNVAELGIGTNEEAILTGNILEDEKILGTAHVAFGASAAIGGTVQVPVHLDCVILEPTVEIDGELLVRDGELLV